jgi:hypothetical protein
MTTPTIPNFLSRAESIGFSYNGQFMTYIRAAIAAKSFQAYREAADSLEMAANRLDRAAAFKSYGSGHRHARTITASTMMNDLESTMKSLRAYATEMDKPITDEELFGED